MAIFGLFILCLGKSPLELYQLIWRGSFGTSSSVQNSLQRSAPLLFTALCVALPAQLGFIIIGGEGAFVLGGLAAAWAGAHLAGTAMVGILLMALCGGAAGAVWIGIAGRCGVSAALTKRFPACCWPISASSKTEPFATKGGAAANVMEIGAHTAGMADGGLPGSRRRA